MTKLISIKKKYSDQILKGKKKVEYRRTNVKTEAGESFFIYTTAPVQKITGQFTLKEKIRLNLEALWEKTRKLSPITREEFDEYFRGKEKGTALIIHEIKRFKKDIDLNVISSIKRPPQSYQNVVIEKKIMN